MIGFSLAITAVWLAPRNLRRVSLITLRCLFRDSELGLIRVLKPLLLFPQLCTLTLYWRILNPRKSKPGLSPLDV